ncbi:hypothetical protein EPA93_39030 [Ktedonosporobacter rubrisoli]|uniref:YtkA-like domain-containing protein n=1 Tax=Ktedonosporobacter rubrisoli TaxID=2509675 RepID=A0A4P6K0I4_KTERU|nr:hypothetical protein [Ktedonosporobacter rubrisoli]QBD81647.1 hypothetical protein EPA93_39030 [Ktedonosporobacter rubrisoli]
MRVLMHRFMGLGIALACLAFSLALAPVARADGARPARTETRAAGPYVIDVGLSQDPPYVDTPLQLTITPHGRLGGLQGQIIAQPGLGTNATNLHTQLKAVGANALTGSISFPVRGAWQIVIELNGKQGHGSADFDVTVAAPGAIPTWLGWLIGMTPLVGIVWWLAWLHGYRRKLLSKREA